MQLFPDFLERPRPPNDDPDICMIVDGRPVRFGEPVVIGENKFGQQIQMVVLPVNYTVSRGNRRRMK